MHILLLSAYDAASHKQWREGLVSALPEHHWSVLSLPPRHFSWRIRGNSLYFADQLASNLGDKQAPIDLVIATSMVDLSTLKGISPALSGVPCVVYFHENQLAYPVSAKSFKSIEPAMVNIYAALAAEKICFNSEYNRASFLAGSAELLKRFPDYVPNNIVKHISDKSQILAVPLSGDVFAPSHTQQSGEQGSQWDQNRCFEIVWNHRWEYDKGPDRLLALVSELDTTLNLRFHIVGQRFSKVPDAMHALHALLQQRDWLGQWGPVADRAGYLQLLRCSDVVLSTAIHDFQGLAVLEGLASGCAPLVPNRLAYPEFIASDFLYPVGQTLAEEARYAAQALIEQYTRFNAVGGAASDTRKRWQKTVQNLTWQVMKPAYEGLIGQLRRY